MLTILYGSSPAGRTMKRKEERGRLYKRKRRKTRKSHEGKPGECNILISSSRPDPETFHNPRSLRPECQHRRERQKNLFGIGVCPGGARKKKHGEGTVWHRRMETFNTPSRKTLDSGRALGHRPATEDPMGRPASGQSARMGSLVGTPSV